MHQTKDVNLCNHKIKDGIEHMLLEIPKPLTIYIGEPHSVAAILPSCRKRANPKSAIFNVIFDGSGILRPQL